MCKVKGYATRIEAFAQNIMHELHAFLSYEEVGDRQPLNRIGDKYKV
jgi:hypothetical protein